MGPRGAGGATQERAGRAGGERHGGFVCVWLGEAGDAGSQAVLGQNLREGEENKIPFSIFLSPFSSQIQILL